MGDGPLREGAPHPERIAQFREQEGREELLRGTLLRRKGGPRADPAPRTSSCGVRGHAEKGPGMAGRARPSSSECSLPPPGGSQRYRFFPEGSRLGVPPAPWARGAPRPCGAAVTAAPGHGPRHGPPHPTLRLR